MKNTIYNKKILISTGLSELGISPEELVEKVRSSEEVYPVLGLRGCRLEITCPSIIEM